MQHKIEVSSCLPYRNYWFVRIGCCDRLKLLFDLVCTFVDLDYDVYHASLDTDAGAAIVEFYIRPRLGSAEFDEAKGLCLAKMLKHAIFRRVPKGLPIRMVTPGPGLRQHVRTSCTGFCMKVLVSMLAKIVGSSSHTFCSFCCCMNMKFPLLLY